MADGFWGVDDFGGGKSVIPAPGGGGYGGCATRLHPWECPDEDPRWGIRRGHGGTDFAPEESFSTYGKFDMGTTAVCHDPYIWSHGDRLRLVVDMDCRTLTIHRDGVAVPGLHFDGLPDEVRIAATLKAKGSTVRICDSLVW